MLPFNVCLGLWLLVYVNPVIGTAALIAAVTNTTKRLLPPFALSFLLIATWAVNKYFVENTYEYGLDEGSQAVAPLPKGSWALVTGATGGLGMDLCVELARLGHNLVISGRNAKKLEAAKAEIIKQHPVQVKAVTSDLGKVGAGTKLAAQVSALKDVEIDILVNNAGMGATLGKFWEGSLEHQETLLTLNLRAVAELTHSFVGQMVKRGRGRVLQVSSLASFLAGPNEAMYHASKAGLRFLSNGIRHELRDTGVGMTIVAPGPFKTPFFAKAHAENTVCYLCALVFNPDSAITARQSVIAMMRGRDIQIPGVLMQATKQLTNILPTSYQTGLASIFWIQLPQTVFTTLGFHE